MTQTTSRFFDELAKLMTDAAGAAHGVRKEVETVVRAQAEKLLNEMDVVTREDFDAVKAMAQKARAENETLAARIARLEAEIDKLHKRGSAAPRAEPTPRPVRKRTRPKLSF